MKKNSKLFSNIDTYWALLIGWKYLPYPQSLSSARGTDHAIAGINTVLYTIKKNTCYFISGWDRTLLVLI